MVNRTNYCFHSGKHTGKLRCNGFQFLRTRHRFGYDYTKPVAESADFRDFFLLCRTANHFNRFRRRYLCLVRGRNDSCYYDQYARSLYRNCYQCMRANYFRTIYRHTKRTSNCANLGQTSFLRRTTNHTDRFRRRYLLVGKRANYCCYYSNYPGELYRNGFQFLRNGFKNGFSDCFNCFSFFYC